MLMKLVTEDRRRSSRATSIRRISSLFQRDLKRNVATSYVRKSFSKIVHFE
jgi:hypothetical protein